jgi:hypothetical protein
MVESKLKSEESKSIKVINKSKRIYYIKKLKTQKHNLEQENRGV